MLRALALILWPQINGISSIFMLAMNAYLLSIIPFLIVHFELGHGTLAQITVCSKVGETLNNLSFGC